MGIEQSKKNMMILLIIALVIAGVVAGYFFLIREKSMPHGLILANGRIEGENMIVAARVPGRIKAVTAVEGDTVDEGSVMAMLDDDQVKARVDQARANMKAAIEGYNAAEKALNLLVSETVIQNAKAEASIKSAKAVLVKARAREIQAEADAKRYHALVEDGSIGRQKAEQAALAFEAAKNDRLSSEAAVVVAEKQLEEARLGDLRIKAKKAETMSTGARADQAKAAVAEAESIMDDLTIKAPGKGVVMNKIINPGEVIAAGSPLFTLVDLDGLYLKIFVPEKYIGLLKLGQKAKIHIDSMPDKPFDGTVRTIASKAEFTPKEVQTPDERVKLVYAVKIYLDENKDHTVTPGIPADAVIRWDEKTEWCEPRW